MEGVAATGGLNAIDEVGVRAEYARTRPVKYFEVYKVYMALQNKMGLASSNIVNILWCAVSKGARGASDS